MTSNMVDMIGLFTGVVEGRASGLQPARHRMNCYSVILPVLAGASSCCLSKLFFTFFTPLT